MTDLEKLLLACQRLAEGLSQGTYLPLMEADIDGLLLHSLIVGGRFPPQELHQNARIVGVAGRRYDLVAGPVDYTPEGGKRTGIRDPQLIVQGKFFPRWGFTNQQHQVHFKHVLHDDAPSLAKARNAWPGATRCILLVDLFQTKQLAGYLSGHMAGRRRIDVVREASQAAGATAIWIHPDDRGGVEAALIE